MRMERLSAQDLSMVWPEDFGWPQDIGAFAIVDGSRLPPADGRFPIEAVREQIGGRLYLLPRFRQRLYMPRRGLGWPLWVDDLAFDIADHVHVFPHDIAGEAQLLAACEQLRRQRLDRSRPLWQMWFLPGLAEGRVGLFMKLHHAVADGVAGVAAFGAFLDLSPTVAACPGLRVLYLIFTEGYAASTGEELLRADLTDEAIRLAHRALILMPNRVPIGRGRERHHHRSDDRVPPGAGRWCGLCPSRRSRPAHLGHGAPRPHRARPSVRRT